MSAFNDLGTERVSLYHAFHSNVRFFTEKRLTFEERRKGVDARILESLRLRPDGSAYGHIQCHRDDDDYVKDRVRALGLTIVDKTMRDYVKFERKV